MSANIVIGVAIAEEAKKIANSIESLNSNEVTRLDEELFVKVRTMLPAALQDADSFYGLKLSLKNDYNMAHSGWIYSRYHEACKTKQIDSRIIVTIFSDQLFREYNQFGLARETGILLGFGEDGQEMLKIILDAEEKYDASMLDSDGYAKISSL